MRRATSDEQKAERRGEVLARAWELFQGQAYHAISMQDLAAHAGLAKGTLYLYFSTKEELFLAVLEQQLSAWFATVEAALSTLPRAAGIDAVVQIIAKALAERPALVRLLAISHAVLEQNSSVAAALRFKQFLYTRLTAAGALIERAVPLLPRDAGARVLLHAYALVVGLHSLAEPAPTVAEALLATPELTAFQLDFAAEFRAGLHALIAGWKS